MAYGSQTLVSSKYVLHTSLADQKHPNRGHHHQLVHEEVLDPAQTGMGTKNYKNRSLDTWPYIASPTLKKKQILETLFEILGQVKNVCGFCVHSLPCCQYILASSTQGKGFHGVHGGLRVRILQEFASLIFNLEGQMRPR